MKKEKEIKEQSKQKRYYEKNKEVILHNAKFDYQKKTKSEGHRVLKVFILKDRLDKLKELKKVNDLTYESLITKFLDDNEKLSLLNEFVGTGNLKIREKWIKFLESKGIDIKKNTW